MCPVGDRQLGLNSLPVEFGIEKAKWICVGMIDVFQLFVAGALAYIGETPYAAAICALVAPQVRPFVQSKRTGRSAVAARKGDLVSLLSFHSTRWLLSSSVWVVFMRLAGKQMFFQNKYFLKDPVKNDVKYQASAQPFLVLGILVTGLAIGHHGPL